MQRQAEVIAFLPLLCFIELIVSCCLSFICVSKECAEAGGSNWLSTLHCFIEQICSCWLSEHGLPLTLSTNKPTKP